MGRKTHAPSNVSSVSGGVGSPSSVPSANNLLRIFKSFAKDEDKATERGSVRSRQSSRRTGSVDSDDRILKTEVLYKQGGRVKSWHRRLFVLRETGLYYYRDEVGMRNGEHLGRVLFVDMYSLTNNEKVAEAIPVSIHILIGFKNVFCVFTETRTYTVAARSKESSTDWCEAINATYHEFRKKNARKNALMENLWRVGGDEDFYASATAITKSSSDVSALLDQFLDKINDQFASDVGRLYSAKLVRKTLSAWKTLLWYRRATRGAGETRPMITAQAPHHNDYFTKKRSVTTTKKRRSIKDVVLSGLGLSPSGKR